MTSRIAPRRLRAVAAGLVAGWIYRIQVAAWALSLF